MKMQKSKVLNFFLAMMPGAGQMYLGFMKQGVSIMCLFMGVIGLAAWLYLEPVLFVLPIIWFYGFFDALNKNSMSPDKFELLEDKYVWSDIPDMHIGGNGFVKKIIAALLITIGLVLLVNNVSDIVFNAMGWEYYWAIREIINSCYKIIIAVVIMIIGVRLIVGKKKEIVGESRKEMLENKEV